jgi:hypothetical protein
VAAMPAAERTGALARVRELIAAGETPDQLPLHVVLGLTTAIPQP